VVTKYAERLNDEDEIEAGGATDKTPHVVSYNENKNSIRGLAVGQATEDLMVGQATKFRRGISKMVETR